MSMLRQPSVSVVMASYNGAELITLTVMSLLRQHHMDFELIIVDDCSTDDTRDVLAGIEDPRIRIIHAEQNAGPVHTRNRGFAEARGRYIAALDQDDLCHPERLTRQVAYLDANPDTVLVGTAADLFTGNRVSTSHLPSATTPAFIDWMLHMRNPIVWSSVMFRADAARTLIPVTRPDRLYAEDFDFYHRMRTLGKVARIDEALLLYRVHAGGASQRFTERLAISAATVLAEANAGALGDDAERGVALMVRHVMLGEPLPDLDTLNRLSDVIERVHRHYMTTHIVDAESRVMIERHFSDLWWSLCRAALRAGTIGYRNLAEARPDAVAEKPENSTDILVSGLIGRVRAFRHG